jgi:hypothetical protein
MNASHDEWKEFLPMLEAHEQKKTVDASALGMKNRWIIF